ncbi:MAG: type II toxin-antitoxin system Phd/YefM family antitoxin [Actinomycetota bacterium]|nr:type II toxin-antitoxin system Phd/YefM family antitoxin [Actinomycetota bacterium]
MQRQPEDVRSERYGRPAAVLVSPEQYEKLITALEDAEDIAESRMTCYSSSS